jgi:predicted alpha/beta-hydrolase family hydrolase
MVCSRKAKRHGGDDAGVDPRMFLARYGRSVTITTFLVAIDGHGGITARLFKAKSRAAPTLVLAHGAGAGQRSPFMVGTATRLSGRGVTVVTFDFAYMHAGRRAPDRPEVLLATWRAVLASTRERVSGQLFAGGKSMGGRIASMLAADSALGGLVFLGYPMHPPGKPTQVRTEHLSRIKCPMLFVQGARDPFGSEQEMRPLVRKLARRKGHGGAEPCLVAGGDHSFKVPKRGYPLQADVQEAIETAVVAFISRHVAPIARATPSRRRPHAKSATTR